MTLGRHSVGFALTRPVSPLTRRLNPRIGLSNPAPISRHTRSEPVAVLSSVRQERRQSVSPSVIPPKLVFHRSFGDGAHPSPKSSHMALPPKDQGAELQKLKPFARAALKYKFPWYGCENWLLRNLLSSHFHG